MNRIIQYETSLRLDSSPQHNGLAIPSSCCVSPQFLLFLLVSRFYGMDVIQFNPLLSEENLGCFQFGAIIYFKLFIYFRKRERGEG